MQILINLIWVLIASIGIERDAYNSIKNGQNDFDYHWVGNLSNSTATIVVTVEPYRGTTLVEAVGFLKQYFKDTPPTKERPSMTLSLIDDTNNVVSTELYLLPA